MHLRYRAETMKKSKTACLAAAALAAAMLLTACGSGSQGTNTAGSSTSGTTGGKTSAGQTTAGSTITKDTIVVANKSDIKSMDPQGQNDDPSSQIICHMYNGLTKITPEGEAVGDLAESFEMVDETTWHFKLREGVKFHDGSELKASDVVFTLNRCIEMPKTKSNSMAFDHAEADGDYDVILYLNSAFPSLPYILSNPNMMIVSEKVVTEATKDGGEYGENPVGTGPFKFVEWMPNDHWSVERFDDYFEGPALARTIECRIIPEGSARAIALETGEIDLALNVDATDAMNIEANPDLVLESGLSPSVEYVGMNCQRGYLADERVRQAIAYALDKEQFLYTVAEGRGEIANSFIGKTIPGWNEELEPYPYDPEKAKELLKEAGCPENMKLNIAVSGDLRNRAAQIVQAQLKEVGIDVEINLSEWGAFLDILNAGEADLFVLGWSNGTCDPEHSITPLFHSKNLGGSGNNTFLVDDKLDQMIDEAYSEVDNDKRLQEYKDIQTYLKELSPWVPLYFKQNLVGRNADLKGFAFSNTTNHYLGNLHYEN